MNVLRMVKRGGLVAASISRRSVSFTVRNADGEEWALEGREGEKLDKLLKDREVPIEASCNGQQACSTCHIVLSPQLFKTLPEAEFAEEDMLSITEEVTDTSRLACGLRITAAMDGETITLPATVKDYWN